MHRLGIEWVSRRPHRIASARQAQFKMLHAAPDKQDRYRLSLWSKTADKAWKGYAGLLRTDISSVWTSDYVLIKLGHAGFLVVPHAAFIERML